MKPIERLGRELSYKGTILEVYTDTVRTKDGSLAKWDYIEHIGAAAVVPVLPDGRILLVRQYRNALDRFTLELPAGKRDAVGEPLEECAARELEEETGYRCAVLEPLITIHTTVAFCNEKIGIFVARDLEKTSQHLDPDEDVEVEAFDPEELLQKIFAGEIMDAKTVAGLLAWRLGPGGAAGGGGLRRAPAGEGSCQNKLEHATMQ